jgi:hypothetical protein
VDHALARVGLLHTGMLRLSNDLQCLSFSYSVCIERVFLHFFFLLVKRSEVVARTMHMHVLGHRFMLSHGSHCGDGHTTLVSISDYGSRTFFVLSMCDDLKYEELRT